MEDKLGKLIEKQKDLKRKIRQARAEQRKREKEVLLERQDRLFGLIRKFEEGGWPRDYEALKNEIRTAIGD